MLWNGSIGKFEVLAFATGTRALMDAMAVAHARGAVTVAAGDDSVAALNAAGLHDVFTHVSVGGGASLQLLDGTNLGGARSNASCCEAIFKPPGQ